MAHCSLIRRLSYIPRMAPPSDRRTLPPSTHPVYRLLLAAHHLPVVHLQVALLVVAPIPLQTSQQSKMLKFSKFTVRNSWMKRPRQLVKLKSSLSVFTTNSKHVLLPLPTPLPTPLLSLSSFVLVLLLGQMMIGQSPSNSIVHPSSIYPPHPAPLW